MYTALIRLVSFYFSISRKVISRRILYKFFLMSFCIVLIFVILGIFFLFFVVFL